MNLDAVNQTLNSIAGKAQKEQGLSAQSFLISLCLYGSLIIACTGLFTWLKNVSYAIFQPSCIDDPAIEPLPRGISWLRKLRTVTEDSNTVQIKHGLESYLVLRFLQVAFKILAVPSLFVLPALLPVYYTAGHAAVTGLDQLSISNVQQGQIARCWIIATVGLFLHLYFCHVLWKEFHVTTNIRQQYLRRMARSAVIPPVLVTNIPSDIQDREILTQIFVQFCNHVEVSFPLESNRVVKEAEYNELLCSAVHQPMQNCRGTRKDRFVRMMSRFHVKRRMQHLRTELQHSRSIAIVQFPSLLAAHLCLQVQLGQKPSTMGTRVIDQSTIIDSRVCRGRASIIIQNCLTTVFLISCSLVWVVPIAMTGLLSQVVYLQSLSAFVARLSEYQLGFIQALLPQVALAALMCGFPLMISWFSKLFCVYSDASRQVLVQRHYFFFLYVQVFLVVSISSSLTTMIPDMIRDIQAIPALLARNLPKACDYFYSYLLMQAVTQCVLAFFQLPRSLWEMLTTKPKTSTRTMITWNLIYPVLTNLLCICMIFSITSPLILPVGTLVSGTLWVTYAYQVIYVMESPVDTAGLLYWEALQHLFVGVYTLDLFLVGLFMLRDAYGPAVLAAVILALVAALQYYSHQHFRPLVHYLSASGSCTDPYFAEQISF
ncbi:putative DUF221 membrane protein [Aspergillus homomorphus CBS 101889]|uniref:DUF221 membrane protein n=1 Tax=Aspergillus homomorphus (strain CBS 101889) TaxID=1450537 RepID=A0A395HG74_ASPHC|nr:DUF221 membrane protein [Aspergillus homomorphus CBS 101889]RAL06473.1 DUF221 membrane protein [Aspergillus homomorphus CBS 101889]